MNQFKTDITNTIKQSLSKIESNIFDDLCHLFQSYFERSCNNILQLRKRTQKTKGECFEIFCCLFLQEKGYQCWLLSELSTEQLHSFNLGRQDVGIDLVAEKNGNYYPVQCKFRKPTKDCKGRQVHRVIWKDLSTFLSLCQRTGGTRGWKKHIIMTNADYCCWKGKKSNKDYTIGKKTFQNQTRMFWYSMVYPNNTLITSTSQSVKNKEQQSSNNIQDNLQKESVRDLRQQWLNKLTINK